MLQNYKQFKEDFLLESVNESIIYYSPKFRKLLSKIEDNEIAKKLLDIEVTDVKPDVTFIDLDPEKDDYLSFTTMRNAIKVIDPLKSKHSNLKEIENEPNNTGTYNDKESRISLINQMYDHEKLSDIFKKSRNPVRIGKFVNKVIPNKYDSTKVEEFVNRLKSSKEQSGERFLMVEGEDIGFWYKSENYLEIKGQLGNSCMKEKPSSYFEIYIKNPEVCKMLVLLEDDKLIGRALIWKLSGGNSYNLKIESGTYFMDRQYTIKESDVDKFRAYAVENNMAYKSNNNHHSLESIIYNGNNYNANIRVDIKDLSYGRFPYMDTFRRYDLDNNSLFNDEEKEDNQGQYILADTGGSYEEIESGIWSEWYDGRISEESAVWSDWADSHLDSDRATYVEHGSRRNHGWYPEDCDDLVYDEWNDYSLHQDDSQYCEAYGYAIDINDAVEVYDEIDIDGEPMGADSNYYHKDDDDILKISELSTMTWYERLYEKFPRLDDYNYALRSLFIENYRYEWIPEIFSINVFKVNDENTEIEYLSEFDSDILVFQIDKSKTFVMDNFEYHLIIESVLLELKEELDIEIKKIKDYLEDKGQLRLKFDQDEDYKSKLSRKFDKFRNRVNEIEDELFIDFNQD